jgi:hypothetical protein
MLKYFGTFNFMIEYKQVKLQKLIKLIKRKTKGKSVNPAKPVEIIGLNI